MRTLEEVRAFFRADRFATRQGIVIDSAGEGEAVCSVVLGDEHRNAAGGVQGGLIFTLADFAFAVAENNQELRSVSLNCTIHFLRAVKGSALTARAVRTHGGRSTCLYTVAVRDDLDNLVAQVSVTGFAVKKPE